MSFRRLFSVAYKELRHITRDVRILFLVTVAPSFLLLTLSYIFALDVERVDLAVADWDHSDLSRELVARIAADGDFVVVADVQRIEQIDTLFVRGVADMAIIIPYGFAADVRGGGPAEVQCVCDGSDAIVARKALALLESRVQMFSIDGQAQVDSSLGLQISSRAWYNPAGDSLISMVPGMMAIILCMPALALALALTREKEIGSFEGLVATPVKGVEYLLGKMVAYIIGGMVGVLLTWLVATLWFRVPFRGNMGVFLLLAIDFLFASMGVSLVISTFVRNQQTAMFLVLMIFFMPSFFMGGLIVPVADEPLAQALAYALPTTHFIAICRAVFLKGIGFSALWRRALALLVFGLAAQGVGLLLFRKKVR